MGLQSQDHRSVNAENCVQVWKFKFAEGVREGVKAAAITCVLTTIPTLLAVRKFRWAKANINYTGQALIISSASIAAYFIQADKHLMKAAKRNAKYRSS